MTALAYNLGYKPDTETEDHLSLLVLLATIQMVRAQNEAVSATGTTGVRVDLP